VLLLDLSTVYTLQRPVLHSDVSTHWGLSFTWTCLHNKYQCCTRMCLHTQAWASPVTCLYYRFLCFTWTCFLYRDLRWTWMCPHYRFLCQALDEFCLLCFDPVRFCRLGLSYFWNKPSLLLFDLF
jgi:hypothetical protein